MIIELEKTNSALKKLKPRYVVSQCQFEQRELLRQSGFKFDNEIKKWYTEDWFKVVDLKSKIDDETKARLEYLNQATTAIDCKLFPEFDKFCDSDSNFSKLKPYQRAAVAYMLSESQSFAPTKETHKAFLLADVPGLGKTMQVIAYLTREAAINPAKNKAIIVCPASIKDNWERELRFFYDDFWKITIVNGGKHKFLDSLSDKDNNLIIVNYDLIQSKNLVLSQLQKFQPDYFVCDEAHYLKNAQAKRVFSVKILLKNWLKLHTIIYMTGTPITNRPKEIHSLLVMLNPSCLGPYSQYYPFARRYCAGKEGKWGFEANGSSNEEELKLRLQASGILIRRKKEEVLTQLPDKTMSVLCFEDNKEANAIIKHYDIAVDLDTHIEALKHWKGRVVNENLATARRKLAIAKLKDSVPAIIEALDSNQKVVVFCWHTEVLNILEKELKDYNPAVIGGKTKTSLRQQEVDRFQNDDNCRVFIGNIAAAGVGITLTAASWVEFVEISWVPGEVAQAIDRCHRLGQKASVHARFHVVKNSVDEVLVNAIIKKNITIKKILN